MRFNVRVHLITSYNSATWQGLIIDGVYRILNQTKTVGSVRNLILFLYLTTYYMWKFQGGASAAPKVVQVTTLHLAAGAPGNQRLEGACCL